VGCLNFVVIWHFPSTVELYAAEQGHKFQGFLVQGYYPTNISLSSSMKGTGFFTSSSSEWEPVTCQATNVSYIHRPWTCVGYKAARTTIGYVVAHNEGTCEIGNSE